DQLPGRPPDVSFPFTGGAQLSAGPLGGLMLQQRLAPFAFLLSLTSACSTVYEARLVCVRDDSGALGVALSHCLETIGLEDSSSTPPYSELLAKEPELVSVWRSPLPASIWSTSPSAVAWVRRTDEQFKIRFVPDSGSTPDAAQMFSDAISH